MQHGMAWRSRRLRRSHAVMYHAVADALPSISFGAFRDTIDSAFGEHKDAILSEHVFQAQLEMDIGRTRRRYATRSGVLQGSSLGGDIFNYACSAHLKGRAAEMLVSNRELIYDGVVTGQRLYMGLTSFVDDAAAVQVGCEARRVLDHMYAAEEKFDAYLRRIGTRKNNMKNVAVADLVGAESHALMQAKHRDGHLHSFARYLGPLLRHDVSFNLEVRARIAAAGRAYKVFRNFLASDARLSIRMLVSRSVAQDTLDSGMVSFPLSRGRSTGGRGEQSLRIHDERRGAAAASACSSTLVNLATS